MKKKLYPIIGINMESISYKFGRIICTFILTDIAWIFFRADSLKNAVSYIVRIFTRWNPWALWDSSIYNIGLAYGEFQILIWAVIILFVVDLIRYVRKERIDEFLNGQGALVKGLCIWVLCVFIMIFGMYGGGFDAKQFIYFQF